MTVTIRPAVTPDELTAAGQLFQAYAAGLGVDLSFQGFDEELASLPGRYAQPDGRLLMAWEGERAVGCIALRRIDATSAEMKRLYVAPEARGGQLGRRLVERLIDEARAAGYTRICLDTLPTMQSAQRLYETLGFREIPPYVFNPIVGTRYMALDLD